ncbi:helix-turn-helix domain-containing protein [Mycolicibacterium farcinogenes]|nr:helix-turn-helix domain-containing protein [Mycolicibacterium farcinogenes]
MTIAATHLNDTFSLEATTPTVRQLRLRDLLVARPGWLTVVTPVANMDRPLSGATRWESARPPIREHLLLVTAHGLTAGDIADALTRGNQAGVSAVVVRTGCLPPDMETTAAVPILALAHHVSWDELMGLIGALTGALRLGAARVTTTAGGLFDLADSAALALDGTVVFVDDESRVLAYACASTVDADTAHTILTRNALPAVQSRRVPAWRRRGATWVDAPGVEQRRLIAPIIVGDRVAGHVMLSPGAETSDFAARMLDDVAAVAAAWFIDERIPADDEDALRTELLRGLLTESTALEVITGRLGRPTTGQWRMLCLAVHGESAAGASPQTMGSAAVERVLARSMRMLNPHSATTMIGEVICALIPHTPGQGLWKFAEGFRQRAAATVGAKLVACLSQPLSTGDEIRNEYQSLRQAVSLLATRSKPTTADLSELRPHVLIAQLASVAAAHPALLSGALDLLRRDESNRGAEYLDTLLSWFDAGCDASRAAAALQVHRNTFRYRLDRIEKLCAVSLNDPVQRFTLEMQVRILALNGGW